MYIDTYRELLSCTDDSMAMAGFLADYIHRAPVEEDNIAILPFQRALEELGLTQYAWNFTYTPQPIVVTLSDGNTVTFRHAMTVVLELATLLLESRKEGFVDLREITFVSGDVYMLRLTIDPLQEAALHRVLKEFSEESVRYDISRELKESQREALLKVGQGVYGELFPGDAELAEHIRRYFGDERAIVVGRGQNRFSLDLFVIPPREDHDYYTVVTVGLSHQPLPNPITKQTQRLEMVINLPKDWHMDTQAWSDIKWFWPIRMLLDIATHAINEDIIIGPGTTVGLPEGETYEINTKLCCALMLFPGVFGRKSYSCELSNGDRVNFLQVIPLYKEEWQLKVNGSLEMLLKMCPDHILEVIRPDRLNVVTQAEELGYDPAFMDDVTRHEALRQKLALPVDELASYQSMAWYLRWCIEHNFMGRPFVSAFPEIIAGVNNREGTLPMPDLRVFLRDTAQLKKSLFTVYFNFVGTRFTCWYNWDNRSTPHMYRKDLDAFAKEWFRNLVDADDTLADGLYLMLPWTEECYQKLAKQLDKRFEEWLALVTHHGQNPIRPYMPKEKVLPMPPSWIEASECFVSDRILRDQLPIATFYRETVNREDQGWDSGWYFVSADEPEEGISGNVYDLSVMCAYDPAVADFLLMPPGTTVTRGADGEFVANVADNTSVAVDADLADSTAAAVGIADDEAVNSQGITANTAKENK